MRWGTSRTPLRGDTATEAHEGGKGYRPRYRKAAVPGKWFYQAVRQDVDEMGQEEVDALMELIVRGLEGLL